MDRRCNGTFCRVGELDEAEEEERKQGVIVEIPEGKIMWDHLIFQMS